MIYFVRLGDAVKIGYTENIDMGFKILNKECDGKLELLKTIKGRTSLEKQLHKKFKHLNIKSEWFRYDKELVDFINECESFTEKTDIRTYSQYTKDASELLGKYIQLARKQKRMAEKDFASRIGVARATLQKIEKGNLNCEIGVVFEAAAILGVQLFDLPAWTIADKLERINDKLALHPKSVRRRFDDNF